MCMWMACGCATTESVRLENVDRLAGRAGFEAAAAASPEWVREALRTVAELEYELERK